MRIHTPFLAAIILLLASTSFAQTTVITPTTTLSAESSNNTSAPDAISGSTNGIATSGNISKTPFRATMYPGATTKIYTTLLGWFGESGHISIGYNSQDPAVVGKQIDDMQSRGIDGTFLAWYGADAYEETTAKALKQQSEAHTGFNFGIMIDHGTITWDSRGLSATDALIYHMNYLAANYYSSPAYLHVNGQPVVIEFGMELENIDWPTVRASVQGNPLVVFRNSEGYTRPLSNGGYAWGPASPVSYLDGFYATAVQNSGKITFGGSGKGFNDSLASWGANRHVSEQCGQTWLNSITDAGNYYSSTNQLPFMMVATWNDYEEGTTIESGIDNCLSISASATNSTIAWSLSGQGQENTVDHYTVFVSTDGQNLMPLTDIPAGAKSLDLSAYSFPNGTYTAYVKVVGKNSLKNHISGPVSFASAGPTIPTPTPTPIPTPTPTPTPTPGDFAIAATPAAQTVARGQSSNYALTLTPIGQLSAPISFTCSGLPSGATCNFASNPVAGTATSTTSLTITTSVTSASLMLPAMPGRHGNPGGLPALGLSLSTAVFGLFGTLSAAKIKRHGKLALLLVSAMLVLLLVSGCGTGAANMAAQSSAPTTSTPSPGSSGSPSTAPKTFTVMVTATSGTTVHTVPLSLTLQ